MLVRFPQFLPDGLDLLTQIVIPLVLVNMRTCPLLNIGFDLQHLDFLVKQMNYGFQATDRIELAKQLCLVRVIKTGILRNAVSKEAAILGRKHFQLYRLCRLLHMIQVRTIKIVCFPAHGTGTQIFRNGCFRQTLNTAAQERCGLKQICNLCAIQSGDQNTDIFILGFEDLLNLCHTAHGIQITQVRIIVIDVLLRH